MTVFCLGSDQIDGAWDDIAPHLYRLERGNHLNVDETRDALRDARNQLWGYQDGVAVIGVVVTAIRNQGRVCEIVAAAGTQTKQGQIEELYAAIERWAREIGCARMKLQGRKGWQRKLAGYRQTGVILEKELNDG